MQGKVCLITGATRGLGQAAALGMARMGATVVIIGRSRSRIENTLALLREETGNPCVEGLQADLASQVEVHRVTTDFLKRYSKLDVLINNVGVTLLEFQASPDGFEMTWALNYLNHFLLTYLLLGAIKSAAGASGEARIVEVTSNMYRFSSPKFDSLQRKQGYNGVLAYSQSKRAMLMYTCEMARRLQGSGVTINAVTPGAVKTDIARDNGWLAGLLMAGINHFALTPEAGVRPILRLAVSAELCGISGKYFRKYKMMPDDPSCQTEEDVRHLWQTSERMVGLLAN